MTRLYRRESAIKRFCDFMGGQSVFARAFERIADWMLMPPRRAAFAGGLSTPPDEFKPPQVMMADGPGTGGDPRPAPTSPHEGHKERDEESSWWDRPGLWNWLWSRDHQQDKRNYDNSLHHKGACQDPKLHGMHGRPCRYEGGSDTKCPTGTVSGWFWYYDVPSVGRIYYVDCCGGGTPKNIVWCNWTSEINWCLGAGRSVTVGKTQYFCTLAIRDVDLKTKDLGGGKYEVVGVDP
jgi:hypothetical protein